MTFEYVREKYRKRLKHLIYVVNANRNSADVEELTTVMRALNKMCERDVDVEYDGMLNGIPASWKCCPNCRHRLNECRKDKHCVHCGQKLRWV